MHKDGESLESTHATGVLRGRWTGGPISELLEPALNSLANASLFWQWRIRYGEGVGRRRRWTDHAISWEGRSSSLSFFRCYPTERDPDFWEHLGSYHVAIDYERKR